MQCKCKEREIRNSNSFIVVRQIPPTSTSPLHSREEGSTIMRSTPSFSYMHKLERCTLVKKHPLTLISSSNNFSLTLLHFHSQRFTKRNREIYPKCTKNDAKIGTQLKPIF